MQSSFEKILFSILNDLYNDTGLENLCLAGGCALNSKFNGLIKEKTPFKKNFFDFVLCQGVIHHMDNDNKGFEEIHRMFHMNYYSI